MLSDRLRAVIRMVPRSGVVLDVGCDHAYTAITLLQEGKALRAVASDLREGPLAAARKHAEEAQLSGSLDLLLCDGIPSDLKSRIPDALSLMPVSCVIAGMGGMLMAGILKNAGENLPLIDHFILSPQSDLALFRRSLKERGLVITDEDMIKEDGKYYCILHAVHGQVSAMSDMEAEFGPVLLKKHHPVLKEYLKKRKRTQTAILLNLMKNGYTENDPKTKDIRNALHLTEEAEKRTGGDGNDTDDLRQGI